MEQDQTTAVMAYLSASYPKQVVSAETMAVYAEHLAGQHYESVMRMARAHVASSAFFPSVAELIPVGPAKPEPRRVSDGAKAPELTPREPGPSWNGWPRAIIAALEAMKDGSHYVFPTPESVERLTAEHKAAVAAPKKKLTESAQRWMDS